MAAAADANPSSMAAVIGADLETVESACSARRSEGGSLWVNINAPGQVVVAGAETTSPGWRRTPPSSACAG